MAISKNQIFEAADQLVEAGQPPTLAAVRKVLGGGSFTTISEAMTEWKAGRRETKPTLREPVPTEIGERMSVLGREIWQGALELANARLTSERETLEKLRLQWEAERQEAVNLADQLAVDVETAQAAMQRSVAQLEIHANEIERLRTDVHMQTEATAAATHRADTLEAIRAELQARVEQLSGLLRKEQAARQEAETEAYRVRQEVTRLTAELAAGERRANELKTRTDEAERAVTEARKAMESAQIAEQATRAWLDAATRETEDLREQLKYERDAARKAVESAAELRGRLAVMEMEAMKMLSREKAMTTESENKAT